MSQETINLLLGALIGIVPTFIITWINHHNQEKKDKQARTWQMEDLFFKRKSDYLENRLLQIEDYASKSIRCITQLANIALDANKGPIHHTPTDLEEMKDFLQQNNRHILGVCKAIRNPEITNLSAALIVEIEHAVKIYEAVIKISLQINEDHQDELDELRTRMSKVRSEATNVYGDLLNSMDHWRMNLRPDHADIDDYGN